MITRPTWLLSPVSVTRLIASVARSVPSTPPAARCAGAGALENTQLFLFGLLSSFLVRMPVLPRRNISRSSVRVKRVLLDVFAPATVARKTMPPSGPVKK